MHNVVTSNWHHSLWQMMTVRKWSGTWQRRSQFGGDPDQGGSQSAGVHIFLWRCCPFGVALQCRDVGGYQPHGPSLGGFPRPGGVATDGAEDTVEVVQNVGVHLGRGSKRRCRFWANGNLHSAKTECGRSLYCNVTDSQPVKGGREESEGMSGDEVMGKGGTLPGKGKGDSGSGGWGGLRRAGGIKKGD